VEKKGITRRAMMAGGTATAIGGRAAARTAARSGAERRPNIIFFLADDMGVADVSCYGAPVIRTPAIDRIAAEGARFSQAYANSSVCSASRVALITGRYQYRFPIGLEEPLAGAPVGLSPSEPTLPSRLRALGYSTALIGKWHLGGLPDYGPLKSGYDHFWGFRGGALDYFSHQFFGRPDLWEGDMPIQRQGYLTQLIGDRTVAAVEDHASRTAPFFLSVHFSAPHWPWEGPEDIAESRRLGTHSQDMDGGTLATYTAMVEAMDRQIGRVLDALERTGQAEDTIVIFSSDNGGERFSNTWPFSGKKTELLEGGLRIPTVVRWPRRIPARQVNDQVMIHMDWLPTLLAAAGGGALPAAATDGMDLLPTLTAGASPVSRTLFWRFKANGQRAVREGDHKALKIGPNSFLFDVVRDPLERANLKDRQREVYLALTEKWMAWNRTMLPETPGSYTYNNDGAEWAERIGSAPVDPAAIDSDKPWPDKPVKRHGPVVPK
jgi:arylsulfatase A-like enzyme